MDKLAKRPACPHTHTSHPYLPTRALPSACRASLANCRLKIDLISDYQGKVQEGGCEVPRLEIVFDVLFFPGQRSTSRPLQHGTDSMQILTATSIGLKCPGVLTSVIPNCLTYRDTNNPCFTSDFEGRNTIELTIQTPSLSFGVPSITQSDHSGGGDILCGCSTTITQDDRARSGKRCQKPKAMHQQRFGILASETLQ